MKKKIIIPVVAAIIVVIVIVAVSGSPGIVPASERPVIASFVGEWNTFAQEGFPHFNLNIPIDRLKPTADGDWATTYQFKFWEGATASQYHRITIGYAKEPHTLQRPGTINVHVESQGFTDSECLIASWGLLIATMLPGGTLEDTGEVLRELEVIDSDADFQAHWKEITRNGVLFGCDFYGGKFTLYGVQP